MAVNNKSYLFTYFPLSKGIEGMARYSGQLLTPADGFGQGQGFFGPSDNIRADYAFLPISCHVLLCRSKISKF